MALWSTAREALRNGSQRVWAALRPELSIAALMRAWHLIGSVPEDSALAPLLYAALGKHLGWTHADTWDNLGTYDRTQWVSFAGQMRGILLFLVRQDDHQRVRPPPIPTEPEKSAQA